MSLEPAIFDQHVLVFVRVADADAIFVLADVRYRRIDVGDGIIVVRVPKLFVPNGQLQVHSESAPVHVEARVFPWFELPFAPVP